MTEAAATATLHLTRTFDAPQEEVFRAWTDPERFRHWFGPPDGSVGTVEMDLRPGGSYRIHMIAPPEMVPEDAPVNFVHLMGTYLEVSPPERIVYPVV